MTKDDVKEVIVEMIKNGEIKFAILDNDVHVQFDISANQYHYETVNVDFTRI